MAPACRLVTPASFDSAVQEFGVVTCRNVCGVLRQIVVSNGLGDKQRRMLCQVGSSGFA